ncbi:MAG: hypothetical protein Q7T82_08520 [Armatimonadota bacterium]|nr:hypothetical protein [Armatimonadota bacterium]
MEDDRIEEILQERYPAPDAEGARGRILGRAARELRSARPRTWFRTAWAFAAAAAVILSANVCDHARQARLSQRTHVTSAAPASSAAAVIERQRLARETLAWAKCGSEVEKQKEDQL